MRSIMGTTIPILLATLLGLNAVASDAPGTAEGQVLTLLRGFEWQLDVDALRAMPADTDKVLLNIARNDSYPIHIKSRAIAALGQFPNDAVWRFLEAELAVAGSIERRRIVDTICQTFSADRPGEVEVVIGDYLKQQDAHLRVNVARCLQTIGSVSALEKVKRYQKSTLESAHRWERDALNK